MLVIGNTKTKDVYDIVWSELGIIGAILLTYAAVKPYIFKILAIIQASFLFVKLCEFVSWDWIFTLYPLEGYLGYLLIRKLITVSLSTYVDHIEKTLLNHHIR